MVAESDDHAGLQDSEIAAVSARLTFGTGRGEQVSVTLTRALAISIDKR